MKVVEKWIEVSVYTGKKSCHIVKELKSESYIFQGDFSEEVHLDQLPEECNDQPGSK